jgi:hypothetical protein
MGRVLDNVLIIMGAGGVWFVVVRDVYWGANLESAYPTLIVLALAIGVRALTRAAGHGDEK